MGEEEQGAAAQKRGEWCWSGEGGGEMAHKSKWGRHCCRPHSHRRVGVLSLMHLRQAGCSSAPRHAWRPMSHAVRGRSSIPRPRARPFGMPEGIFPRLASSPALAPASGHRLSASFTPPLSRGFARALRLRSSEAETVRLSGSRSQTVAFGLTLMLPQSRSKLAVLHVDDFALLSNDPPCAGPRPEPQPSA